MERAALKQVGEMNHDELCEFVRDALELVYNLEHDIAAIHLQPALDALGRGSSANGTYRRWNVITDAARSTGHESAELGKSSYSHFVSVVARGDLPQEIEALSLIAHGHDAKFAALELSVSSQTNYERLRRARKKHGA